MASNARPGGARLATLLLCGLLAISARAAESPWSSPWARVYDPAADAVAELNAALNDAKRTERLVLVVVGGDWCAWCHTLDRYFSRNQDLRQGVEETFVVAKLYFEAGHPNGEILDRFPRLERYPHFLIFDPLHGYVGGQLTGVLENHRKVRFRAYDTARVRRFVEGWESYRQARPTSPADGRLSERAGDEAGEPAAS